MARRRPRRSCFELAAQSTPNDPGLVRQRRLRAADCHRLAGDPERAAALLEQLLAEVPSGVERADFLLVLISMLSSGTTMVERCDAALAEADDDDARAARILAFRCWGYLLEGDVGAALADARAALEAAERVGDPILIAVAIGRVGQAEMWAGEVTPGLLERGAEIEERLGLWLESCKALASCSRDSSCARGTSTVRAYQYRVGGKRGRPGGRIHAGPGHLEPQHARVARRQPAGSARARRRCGRTRGPDPVSA